jgi:hypothetical protein
MARSRALAASPRSGETEIEGEAREAGEPLVRGVLERLLADEGSHARLGFWFLEWAPSRPPTR